MSARSSFEVSLKDRSSSSRSSGLIVSGRTTPGIASVLRDSFGRDSDAGACLIALERCTTAHPKSCRESATKKKSDRRTTELL